MKIPPLLLGTALLFWGWHAYELFPFAVIMAFLIEASRLVKWRWDLSTRDFSRVSDLCVVAFLVSTAFLLASHEFNDAFLLILQWLPLVFFPLILSQTYSTAERINLSAFFLMLRRKREVQGGQPPAEVSPAFPYLALCILSASAGNLRTVWFYAGVCLLSAWALWFTKAKQVSPLLWSGMFILAAVIGYGGQMGLHGIQKALENKLVSWFMGVTGGNADTYHSYTAMGEIGTLKQSHRIMLRVKPNPERRDAMLLRTASYNVFRSATWFASKSSLNPVQPEPDGTTWFFKHGPDINESVVVSAYLKQGKGALALPNKAFKVKNLPVLHMQRNELGAVKIDHGPGLITYEAMMGSEGPLDRPPDETDLWVPEEEEAVIFEIAGELDLALKSPEEVLRIVDSYFQNQFHYSLMLTRPEFNMTPLEEFLRKSKSGHCEYFATATTLLLRQAGIPARYAIGFSVQEFSQRENMFIVRARHAHSWTLAYIDGRWKDVDTTPASWMAIENETTPIWQPALDLWSQAVFLFSKWRWSDRKIESSKYLGWVLIPLIVILVWRVYSKKRMIRFRSSSTERGEALMRIGKDSDFYQIEKKLQDLGFARFQGETLSNWIKRLDVDRCASDSVDQLHGIIALHYRYRFDPNGISTADRTALASNVQSWLTRHGPNSVEDNQAFSKLGTKE